MSELRRADSATCSPNCKEIPLIAKVFLLADWTLPIEIAVVGLAVLVSDCRDPVAVAPPSVVVIVSSLHRSFHSEESASDDGECENEVFHDIVDCWIG